MAAVNRSPSSAGKHKARDTVEEPAGSWGIQKRGKYVSVGIISATVGGGEWSLKCIWNSWRKERA